MKALRRAIELAPLSNVSRFSLRLYGYYFGRRFDELIDPARLESDYLLLGNAYLQKGMYPEARDAFGICCEDDTLNFWGHPLQP